MKRMTFSVVFFCKKTKLTKKGKAPIYARITTSGQISEIHRSVRPYRDIGTSVWNAVSTQLPQGIRPKNTITEQIENLKGQQETLPVDVRYYSFAGAVEGRADGL